MPTLPWITPNAADPEAEATVMASRLEVKSLRQVPGFFFASIKLWRQARRSDGAWGLSLRAQLLKRTFWTVSAWSDKKALYAYAGAEPHKSTMKRLHKVMKDSTFVFWNAQVSELPITYEEVERRIAEEEAKGGTTS
ncbi:hypothetical protein J4573_18025 [Actinomadura barringtoniae]|uniref:DUF3291 domain-containing protein n=1 Tax=Actinomadura barringtoniae TaxID=1427535 RepID=A0A939PAE7_9ACTN|nr:hypothetical protein [Actinomadura barringtoniae]MBO2449006.1 hypothetical protein [Actinomadura barringtoniae]